VAFFTFLTFDEIGLDCCLSLDATIHPKQPLCIGEFTDMTGFVAPFGPLGVVHDQYS
jgi:hypothetical protein